MYKICLPGRFTEVLGDGRGQTCAVAAAQSQGDPGGWWILLHTRTEAGLFVVKRVVLTPAYRARSRIVLRASVPAAVEWEALVQPPATGELLRVELTVSDLPIDSDELADVDGQPGSKGWNYTTNGVTTTPTVVTVPPGARLREVSAVATAAGVGGLVHFAVARDATSTEALGAFTIPAGRAWALPEEAVRGLVGPVSVTFVGDLDASAVVWVE